MKNDKLINAIGKIDDDLIESAEESAVNELSKRRGRRWLYAAVAAALLAAAVFVTAAALNKSGNGGDETNDPSGEGGSADTSYAADTDGESRTGDDVIGKLVIDGVTFIQIGSGNEAEKYTKAEFLGKASSFEGSYADGDLGVDGDVYTVSEDEELLVITLSNGGAVLLENAVKYEYEDGHIIFLRPGTVVREEGEELTDEEAASYFAENGQSIASALSASGVPTEDLIFSKRGYCHLFGSGTEGEMTVAVGYRDYPVYSGEKLVAIVTLFKEDGKIYSSPIFGADWFDSFDKALRQYDGEDLTMIYGPDNERIVGPNGMIFIPSALLGNG